MLVISLNQVMLVMLLLLLLADLLAVAIHSHHLPTLAYDLDDDVDEVGTVQAHPINAEAEDEADYDGMVHDNGDGDDNSDDTVKLVNLE
jgi:hypothetical protein